MTPQETWDCLQVLEDFCAWLNKSTLPEGFGQKSIQFSGHEGCLQIASIETTMALSAPIMWDWAKDGFNLNVIAASILASMQAGLKVLHGCNS